MKLKEIDVLFIRQNYPSKINPVSSNWVFEQVSLLNKKQVKTLVLSPTPYIPKILRLLKSNQNYPRFSKAVENYKGTSVIRPEFIKFPNLYLYSISNKSLQKAIMSSSKDIKAKIIHAHFGYDAVASLPLKRKWNVPLIVTFYGGDVKRFPQSQKNIYSELVEEADIFLAISKEMKKDLIDLGFPSKKIKVWKLGIDTSLFQPLEDEIKGKGLNFLTVSRLRDSKRIQDSILAFKEVNQRFPNTKYTIVGFGPYESKLKSQVRDLGLEKNIEFINNLERSRPREVVLNEMQKADIFLLPTAPVRRSREGTPLVLIEAQCCGLPSISTNYAGIPEVVVNGKTGFIVDPYDIQAMIINMSELVTNSEMREVFSQNSRKHILEHHNQKIQIKKLLRIYEDYL